MARKQVTDSGLRDNQWVVTSGLNAGDRVIVEGSGKAKPGETVRTIASTGAPGEAAAIDKNPSSGGSANGKGGAGGVSGAAR